VNFANLAVYSGVEKNTLRGGSLTGIDVRGYTEVPKFL